MKRLARPFPFKIDPVQRVRNLWACVIRVTLPEQVVSGIGLKAGLGISGTVRSVAKGSLREEISVNQEDTTRKKKHVR